MGETRRILDQFHRAYEGPAWHGPALLEVLKGVTWQSAAQRPIPGGHTIWELVLHIAVWISVPLQRIQGAVMPTLTPAEDWPTPPEPSEPAWHQALAGLAAAHSDMEAALGDFTDDRLRDTVLGEVPYSIYTMLHGVVQHMLYHAGQIALLKKAAQ